MRSVKKQVLHSSRRVSERCYLSVRQFRSLCNSTVTVDICPFRMNARSNPAVMKVAVTGVQNSGLDKRGVSKMSDQDKVVGNNIESKGDVVQGAFGSADSYSKLANEAFAEMSKNRLGGANSSTEANKNGRSHKDEQNEGVQRDGKFEKHGDPADKSERIKDGLIQEAHRRQFELVRRPYEDGASKLATGDTLVKDGDQEMLFMPNGDKLKVNKDGSYSLNAKGGVTVKSEDGSTTITYANGDSVTFSKNGIDSISRGNVTVDIIDKKLINIHPGLIDRFPEPPQFKPWKE